MKQISHREKILWQLYCTYSYIKEEEYYCYWAKEIRTRTSKKGWDFIHKWYHYVTKVDPIYSGDIWDFKNYLEKRSWDGTYCTSPYKFKKQNKRRSSLSWKRHNRPNRSFKYRKKPHHKKKELSIEEQNKRAWRKKVKDPRDQGRRFYNKQGWTDLQHISNRKERRKIKRIIHNCNDWDSWSHPTRREFLDPWDYY